MNCSQCVFSTRKMLYHQKVDWCGYQKAQKEITKETVICEHFLQKKSTMEEHPASPMSHVEPIPLTPTTPTASIIPFPTPEPLPIDLSQLDHRQLAYEAEKALLRIKEQSPDQQDLSIIEAFLTPIIENEREKEYKDSLFITTSFNKFNPNKELAKVIHAFSNSVALYKAVEGDLRKFHRRQQDILHAYELTDLSEEDLVEYTKEMKKLRLLRRQAKNFLENLEPFYHYSLEHQPLIKELRKLQGEMEKIKQSIESRKYFVREETALKQAFEEAEPLHKRMNDLKEK